MTEPRGVHQAPLESFRAVHCKRCQMKDTCRDDRGLENNCVHAALWDEMVFARQLRMQR
jgi:hypothetical protein